MSDRPASPTGLLRELAERILATPGLAAEWSRAREVFTRGSGDPACAHRFQEWFLLERTSDLLGAPPVVALAPDPVPPGSPWERLLDSFLGIFRPRGGEVGARPGGAVWMEDLWSRRPVPVRPGPLGRWPAGAFLAVGRLVLAGDEEYEPLPGLLVLRAPGLAEAVERDLAAIRAADPRARLSQETCERLFAPFLAPTPPGRDLEELERGLAAVVEDSGLTVDGLRRELLESGPGEVLDRLAFDTSLDLEYLRTVLLRWHRLLVEGSREPDPPGAPPRAPLSPAAALARFDAGRDQGRPLAELFRELEEDLGLPPGASEEEAEADAETDPSGVRAPASFVIWVRSFLWEARRTPGSGEGALLERLAAFLDAAAGPRELRHLRPGHVIAFLLREEPEALPDRARALRPFLEWAVREQEAELGDLPEALTGELARRLQHVAACNAAWRREGRQGHSWARVQARESGADARVQVRDEAGTRGPLQGLDEGSRPWIRCGDAFLGSWDPQGGFQAAAWLPAEARDVLRAD